MDQQNELVRPNISSFTMQFQINV